MTKMNIRNTRIQGLVVFRAILETRSITATADALGITQSGVSKQLKLLRESFGDELFVRTGSGMEATKKALSIAPRISSILREFEELSGEVIFNPAEVEGSFVISTSDEVLHFLVPGLITELQQAAPKTRLIFKVLESDYGAKQLESGQVNLVISLNWHVPEHLKQRRLFTDDFVCVHRKGHPLKTKRLTVDRYVEASHMMVSPRGTGVGPIDEILAKMGRKRHVSLSIPHFMQAGYLLQNTDMLIALQRGVALQLLENYDLSLRELPLPIPPVSYFLFWHKRYDKDSTNKWLRNTIYDILSSGDSSLNS